MNKDEANSSARKKRDNGARPIYLVSGCKGGVGKSTVAMALMDFLLTEGARTLLIETDTSAPDVGRTYRGSVETHLLDLDEKDGWLELLNVCSDHPDSCVVINGAARNSMGVNKYGELLNMGLSYLERRLVTLWVINTQRASLELLKKFMGVITNSTVHVVRNEFFGDAKAFRLYNRAQLRKQIEGQGGKSLIFPCLDQCVMDEIYLGPLTIAAAMKELRTGNRVELQRWRREVSTMCKEIMHV